MTDVYKVGHEGFYPDGLTDIYSYLTTRSNKRYPRVVFAGLQAIIKKTLMKPCTTENVREFIGIHQMILGKEPSVRMTQRLHNLVNLGYWPLRIKAVKEGTSLPHKQCLMTIESTHEDYAWLVGFFESMLLKVWNVCSVATNSKMYHDLVKKFSDLTCDNDLHIPFAVHDFGYRGVSSEETAELSGLGHLFNFYGTDTIPAVWAARQYYNTYVNPTMPVGLSVPATEHSTMSTNIMMVKEILEEGGTYLGYGIGDMPVEFNNDVRLFSEALVIKNIITNIVPTGIVSIVSDTYDYFGVLNIVAPWLKADIEAREDVPVTGSKVVFRPDSGDPQEIITESLPILQRVFGSTVNEKGYSVLNPKVGLIYGDGMYFERYQSILEMISSMGFATSNLVIGVGGLLLQQHSRDDLGFAVKATEAIVDGRVIEVYKDPATDSNKKSHKGRMVLNHNGIDFETTDQVSKEESDLGLLEIVYENGVLLREQTLEEVRGIISGTVLS